MSVLAAGWVLAVAAATLLLLERRSARRTAERVVRACHELRGPLTTVLLALDRPGSATVEAVAAELDRARRAVDDVSAAVARRRAADERRPVDLRQLAEPLVEVHDALARRHGRQVRLDVRAAPAVLGDRSRLAEAVGNLLRNALEHGTGPVVLRIDDAGGRARLEVLDGGPGLPAPVDVLLRDRRRGQRGRGLAIAREVAGAHGGSLRAAPSAAGARLVLELPAHRALPREVAR